MAGAPLLEREAEMAQCEAVLEAARAGESSVLLVEGPAGIGKTTLLGAVRETARKAGMLTLAARGSELEREYGFGVVHQLLDPVVARSRGAERKALFAGAAGMARPLFESGDSTPEVRSDPGYEVLHGLYWLLTGLPIADGAVVAVDDAQWSDLASLRFLHFLQARLEGLPIALILCVRSGSWDAQGEVLARMAVTPEVGESHPEPLSEAGVGHMLESALGATPETEFVAACSVATGGNPFLVGELAAELARQAIAPTAHNAERVEELHPRGVARATLARLSGLPPAAPALARAVAILGDACEPRLAAELADLETARVDDLAELLRGAGIFQQGGSLGFAHPLLLAAVTDEIPANELSVLHGRAARLLWEQQRPADVVAAHLLHNEPASDPWVLDTLRAGARKAREHGAAESAATYLERALREPASDSERSELLWELAMAEQLLLRPAAIEHMAEAHRLAVEPSRRAKMLFDLVPLYNVPGRETEAVALLDAAIAEQEGRDDELAGLLEAERQSFMAEAFFPAAGSTARAFELLERLDPGGQAAHALLSVLCGKACLACEPADQVVAAAEQAVGSHLLTMQRYQWGWPVIASVMAERYDFAETCLDALLAAARRDGAPPGLMAYPLCWKTFLTLHRGRLADAEVGARTGVAMMESSPFGIRFYAGVLLEVLIERGELDEGRRFVEQTGAFETTHPARMFHLLPRVTLELAQGRPETALHFANHARGLLESIESPDARYWQWRLDAALAHQQMGHPDEAQQLAADELAAAERWGAPGGLGCAHRVAGLVDPNRKAAVERLQHAVELLAASERRLEHARALASLGAALRRAGQRRDAREPLRAAAEIAHECGAEPIVEFARDELRATGEKLVPLRASGADALTPSEARIASLAADGETNREIAQTLFLTVKTVEMHLSNAYRKLDIRSRKELASALGR